MRINPNETFEVKITWPCNTAASNVNATVYLHGISGNVCRDRVEHNKSATTSSIENFNKAFKASNTKYKNAVLYLVKEKIHSNLKCRS